jgi:hypothetical protein
MSPITATSMLNIMIIRKNDAIQKITESISFYPLVKAEVSALPTNILNV